MHNPEKLTVFYDDSCPTCNTYKDGSTSAEVTWESNSNHPYRQKANKEIIIESDGEIVSGVDAIALIEESKGNRFTSKILRNPILKPIFIIGYKVISYYRREITGPAAFYFWSKTTIGLGVLGASIMSWRLWTNWHDFPAAPLLGNFGELIYQYGSIPLGLAYFATLVWLILSKKNIKVIALVLVFISVLLVIGDLNRLRPWLYQLMILLVALVWSKNSKIIPHAFIWALAGTYFWGGVQKMNEYFVSEIFPWFVSPITKIVPLQSSLISLLAVVVVIIEATIGITLLFKKTRFWAAILATLTHLTIVTVLPIGHNWGFVVLFWNLALLVIVWLLEKKGDNVGRFGIVSAFVLILVWILPVMNWFGLWDNYLSSALYAHETDPGYIVISDDYYDEIPLGAQRDYIIWDDNNIAVDSVMWSHENFNTVLYTKKYSYEAVLKEMCTLDPNAQLYLREQVRRFRTIPGEIVTCDVLQKNTH